MKLTLAGSTVVITGASSGIGLAFARLIAPEAKRLVLVARRLELLEAIKQELARPSLEVFAFACDLAKLDETQALCARIDAEVGEVDVLINNAGVGDFTLYDRADWDRTEKLITLDITSLALLTHHFVRGMVARGRGGILNMSSGYGVGVTPAFAAYIGAKHFVTGFSEALRLDLVGTGVIVTQACPGPVKSEFAGRVGYGEFGDPVPSFLYQSAESCARQALRGLRRGRAFVVTGWLMKFVYFLIAISPRFLRRWVMIPAGKIARRRLTAGPSSGAADSSRS
jgi:short-subunit dehydrogenase